MNKELISVIVPVYNAAPWLRRCLDSICCQSYSNLEILCINDGSTDNSAVILDEYAAKDNRIRVITQQNAGLSAARNAGLENATGEWVTGVDADDYITPDVYEKAVACIAASVDMVAFGVQMVDDEGTEEADVTGYFRLPSGTMPFTEFMALNMNVCFWNKLWRRSLIERHGLRFPFGLVHEDEAFFYLAAPWLRQVAFSTAVGYYYVQRRGSIMHSGKTVLDDARNYLLISEYVRMHIAPENESYWRSMRWNLYNMAYRRAKRSERDVIAEIFRSGVTPDETAQDYRTGCILSKSTRWVRYEPQRVAYCLAGVPVIAHRFDGLRFTGWQFALWQVVRAKMAIVSRVLFRRKA